jgi:hypothetical protein
MSGEREMKPCITKYVIVATVRRTLFVKNRPCHNPSRTFLLLVQTTRMFQNVPVTSTSKRGNTILALSRMRLKLLEPPRLASKAWQRYKYPAQLARAHTNQLTTLSTQHSRTHHFITTSSTKCLSPITSSTIPTAASVHSTASLTTLSTREPCSESRTETPSDQSEYQSSTTP